MGETNASGKRQQASQRIKPAVVAIGFPVKQPDGSATLNICGSGFNISPNGRIVTCHHVIENFLNVSGQNALDHMRQHDGQYVSLKIQKPIIYFFFLGEDGRWAAIQKETYNLQGDPENDIAIIEFPPGDFRPGAQKEYPFVDFSDEVQLEGEEIGVVGFPLGDTLHRATGSATYSFHYGYVGAVLPFYSETEKPSNYQLDVFTNPGNSGGPVFRVSDGKVIGMLASGFITKSKVLALQQDGSVASTEIIQPHGMSYAVPAWHIQENIQTWGKDAKAVFKELRKKVDK